MFPFYLGINEKFINLQNVVLIEDRSTDTESIAVITTPDGGEIELTGSDADLLFDRAATFAAATEHALTALINAGSNPQNQ